MFLNDLDHSNRLDHYKYYKLISIHFFNHDFFQALDWCPFQRNLLATGGGTADRHIRFWNAATGTCLNSVDTKSQVRPINLTGYPFTCSFATNYHLNFQWPTLIWPCSSVGTVIVICSGGHEFKCHRGWRFFLFLSVGQFLF